jgi:hypothetical protein
MDNSDSNSTSISYYYYPIPFNYYHTYYVGLVSLVEVWVNRVVPAIACLIGIPACLLVIGIITVCHCGISTSARFYHVVIACGDLLELCSFYVFEYIGFVFRPTGTTLVLPFTNMWSCRIGRWLSQTAIQLTLTTMAVFCVERVYVISHPIDARFSTFKRNAVITTVALIVFAFISNTAFLFGYGLVPIRVAPYTVCTYGGESLASAFTNYGTIWSEMIPVLVELACNMSLMIQLYRIGLERRTLLVSAPDPRSETAMRSQTNKEMRSALVLVVMASLHCCFFLPDGILWLLLSVVPDIYPAVSDIYMEQLFNAALITFFHCSLFGSINFILYLIQLPRFRHNVVKVLSCGVVHRNWQNDNTSRRAQALRQLPNRHQMMLKQRVEQ